MSMKSKKIYGKDGLTRKVLAAFFASSLCCAPVFAAENDAADEATDNAVNDLGATVVTAERIPTERMDTPANVTVITAKEIAANHYATVGEAVEHVNGVTVTRMGGQQQEIVRLNGDERVIVLVDGERVNNDQGASSGRSSADLHMIPSMKNIQRIEIVKGGGSALYGSDAVGGVINIITKKGVKNETTVDLSTGSWKTHSLELTNQGTDGNYSWFVTGAMTNGGNFDYNYKGTGYKMDSSDYRNRSFSLRLDGKIDDRSSAHIYYGHRSVNAAQYDCRGDSVVPPFSGNKMTEVFNNVSASYRFKEGTAAPGFLRVFNNYKTVTYGTEFNTLLWGFDYQNGWKLDENNTLIAGAEWHRSNSSNEGSGYYKDKEITNKALYVQDTMKLGKLSFVPGVRIDHHSMFGTHWTPKAALNYRPDEATQFYASWGRVFKAPTADDLYWNDPWMKGNPNLDPETGWTATLGVNHKFNDKTSMGVSYFESRLDDAIRWANSPSGWTASNINKEKKRGIELSFRQRLDDAWSYDLGYSYICTELDKGAGVGYVWENGNSQPNGYRIGLHYAKGPWKANVLGRIGSGLDEAVYLDHSYAIWDFNVSYDIKENLTAYFRINNLTDEEYYTRKLSSGWLGNSYYPGTGRFYQIGLTCSF